MVFNRSHLPWAVMVLVLTVISAVLYLANFHPEMVPVKLPAFLGPVPPVRRTVGGTPLGLIFGSLALGIFIFAALLGLRKKRRTWPIGRVKFWLKAHIWLTILTLPLVAFHCGFHAGGPMTTTLMVLYGIVMITGFVGIALQHYMPRYMTEALPREVVYEQIPYLRRKLVQDAEDLRRIVIPPKRVGHEEPHGRHLEVGTAESGGPILALSPVALEDEESRQVISEFLHNQCLTFLKSSPGARHPLASQKVSDNLFRILRVNVSERWANQVDRMQSWCDDRRLMDKQSRLHLLLHGWLLLHVPVSFALLVFTFWHAYIAITYL